ncbi:MAG: hypothetical protein NC084_05310 [Bacteroides sp.]|nr:hypothetical protein [Eubacterium sp.]MCM1418941.1 hypothetical protein [Roseburia sp.]MCM1462115.1 hypothetical protein [Bacteroides sp.]
MKKQRQSEILAIIGAEEIENQEMLIERLRERGYRVTQATVSRDLSELNLEKAVSENGVNCYMRAKRASGAHSALIFRQSVLKIDCAGNIVCVKCRSGLADGACVMFESLNLEGVVGTIAGDDTFFALIRTEGEARRIAESLRKML